MSPQGRALMRATVRPESSQDFACTIATMTAPGLPRLRMSFTAEEAYLFAHATLREAAYQLWLPSDRARLHAFALEILEALPAAELERISPELAEHAHWAQQGVDAQRDADVLATLRGKELVHLKRAKVHANSKYQRQRVIHLCRRILEITGIGKLDEAESEQHLAQELLDTGKLDGAEEHFRRLQQLGLALGSGSFVSMALVGMARIAGVNSRKTEAEQLLNEAFDVAHAAGDIAQQCVALNWLGGLLEDTGRAHQCESIFLRSVEIARTGGIRQAYLSALGTLANHYRHIGRIEESARAMREVLAGFEEIGNPRDVSVALNNMARTLMLLGRLDEADAAFSRALELLAPAGQVFSVAFSLGNVADIWLQRGKVDQARDALRRAIAICDETASLMYSAAYKASLAGLELLTGRRELAHGLIEESRSDFIHSGAEQYVPDYCDIVRLRIAADAATDSAALAGRKTAKINALAPRASWLPIMRQILQGMKKSLSAQKAGAFELKRGIALGESLLAEIEAAVQENRPTLVFHGFLPSELSIELRGALLQTIARTPASDALPLHAALDRAMRAGVSIQSK
jgi:tetratricopeptide (TPR) repeat protein